jgi:hypothetical protein
MDLMTDGKDLCLHIIPGIAPLVKDIVGIAPGKYPLFDAKFHGIPSCRYHTSKPAGLQEESSPAG